MKQPSKHDRICNMVFGTVVLIVFSWAAHVDPLKAGAIFLLSGAFWHNMTAFLFKEAVDEYYAIRNGEDDD